MPAVSSEQMRLIRHKDRPTVYVSWAFLSDEAEPDDSFVTQGCAGANYNPDFLSAREAHQAATFLVKYNGEIIGMAACQIVPHLRFLRLAIRKNLLNKA
jgi:hypothetical protein